MLGATARPSPARCGVIQDAQGPIVPGEGQGTASARTVMTSPEGTFVFSPVLAGKYTVTVEMMGFKKYEMNSRESRST
jgi:hypothetical protein